jgi:hypothetical protein
MKNLICCSLAAVSLLVLSASASFAASLDDLAGKWTLTRTNDEGQVFTQTLEFKKDKFTFQVSTANKTSVMYARGDVKTETTHSLNVATFTNIEGGADSDDLHAVDDDRSCIFTVDGSTFTIALDFDKDRGKSPRVEVYTKAEK